MNVDEIKEWYVKPFEKFLEFSGRSRRKEFWTFVLVNLGIMIILNILDAIIGLFGIIATLFSLAILIPNISVGVRRLHDSGRSGWWLLLSFIPLIGVIVLIYFFVQDSEPGPNQYGSNPKEI